MEVVTCDRTKLNLHVVWQSHSIASSPAPPVVTAMGTSSAHSQVYTMPAQEELAWKDETEIPQLTAAQMRDPIKTGLLRPLELADLPEWPLMVYDTVDRLPESTKRTVFTHMSIDSRDNYDDHEFLGDRMVASGVARIIHERHRDRSLGFRNIMFTACINRHCQSLLLRSLGLDSRINMLRKALIPDRIREDVFEALTAAILLDLGYDALWTWLQALYVPVLELNRQRLESECVLRRLRYSAVY
jgi:dsRNA-specific ribonuclease